MTPDPKAIELMPFFINERHDEVDSWIEIHEHIAHGTGKARRFVCEFNSIDRKLAMTTLDALNGASHPREEIQPVSGVEEVTVEELAQGYVDNVYKYFPKADLNTHSAIAQDVLYYVQHFHINGIKIKAGGG